MDSKQLGTFGENIACKYLEQKGYKILDRNYVPKWMKGVNKKEVDTISKQKDVIHFVEVKTLACAPPFDATQGWSFRPEGKVNFQKREKIVKVAESWLTDKKYPPDTKWQVDVISVRVDLENKKAKIKHFENI